MKGYAVRVLCSVVSLWLVAVAIPGFSIRGGGAWLVCALAVGLSNGLLRTAIVFYLVPLGLGAIAGLSLALNALVIALLAVLLAGVVIESALAAVIGWFVRAGVASVITQYIGPDGRFYSLIPASRPPSAS